MSAEESRNKSVQGDPPLFRKHSAISWWPKAIAFLGALLFAAGAFIALFHPVMLVSAQTEMNGAVHIYAGYLASRNLALAIMLVAVVSLGARRTLGNLLTLAGLIQLLDAGMDIIEGRWPIVAGVVALAVLFFAASSSLSGYPFWNIQAWKETD